MLCHCAAFPIFPKGFSFRDPLQETMQESALAISMCEGPLPLCRFGRRTGGRGYWCGSTLFQHGHL